ncbi:hypothetical protein BCD64_05520 [Nostoc sp. MBR 210]|nr:hypothetical protein BCD64_05520 [Nostoc sp. MBR 210]
MFYEHEKLSQEIFILRKSVQTCAFVNADLLNLHKKRHSPKSFQKIDRQNLQQLQVLFITSC